jgi:hypothetical protein
MRLSLSVDPCEGACSKCGAGPVLVLVFAIVTETHDGTADKLCQSCLFHFGGNRVDIPMEELAPGRVSARKGFRQNKRRSRTQERDIAEELGARVQPASGAMSGAKGDVRKKGVFRLEAKFTRASSYTLHLEDLEKIAGECGVSEKPIVVIDYLEPGTSKLRDRFAVLHFHDMKELLNAARKYQRPKRTP